MGRERITKKCLNCGNTVHRGKNKYCSNACQFEYQYTSYVEKWRVGVESGLLSDGSQISNHVRRFLLEKYHNKCSLCGWSEINKHTGKIPLEVDHIDGNHSNNKESNLTILCPNCHSLTPTYKGANLGNGRSYRRKSKGITE